MHSVRKRLCLVSVFFTLTDSPPALPGMLGPGRSP